MTISAGAVIDGRYRVVRLLGEGGYGAVYLAEDTRLGDKTVALKEGFDKTTAAQEQFRLEAQILAELNHPGLPRVTDHFVEKDGRQFLVMDYVEGDDLDARLLRTGKPLPEAEAVALMLQVCEAVAYLHTRRPQPIIHRDIKPANIKITRDGRAILVDFGIAKIYHPTKGTAKIAKAVTPHFSSPEQHVARTDPRSDVYSLGATLYLLLTAELPPDAMDRLNQNTPVIPPGQLNPQLSPVLEQIVLQALDLTADRRFMNANRLSAALRSYIFGRPVSGPLERVCPRCGWRNRASARYCIKDGAALEVTVPGKAAQSGSQASAAPVPASASAAAAPVPSAPNIQSVELLFESTNALARNREYARAAPGYEACLQQGFSDLAVYYNLGICYLEMGRYADAASVLEKGAARYPKDGDTYYQLARVYDSLNMKDRSLVAAARACEISPDDAANLRQYGRLLFESKRFAEAARQLEQALRLDPQPVGSYLLLGRAYGELKNLRMALETLEKAARLDPRSAEPHYWMGVYYHNARKRRQALTAIEQALRLSPNHQPSRDLLKNL